MGGVASGKGRVVISDEARAFLEGRLRHLRARIAREDRPVVLAELREMAAVIERGLAREVVR